MKTTSWLLAALSTFTFHVRSLAQAPTSTIERSGTDLLMRMNDLIPGDTYYIAIKTTLTDDIRDRWVPVFEFTPSQSSAAVTFQPSDPREFDIVVNASRWQGPQPRLSLVNGATLSGKVNIQGIVTDILAQEAVELWVDGEQVGRSTSLLAFELDTRRFANGPHTLTLVSHTVPFGNNGDFQGQGLDEKEVIFDNDVCFTHNLPMDPGHAMHLHTRETIDYRFRVFKADGTLIRERTGTQTPGDFDLPLDVSGPGEPMETGQFYRLLFSWGQPTLMAGLASPLGPPPLPPPPPRPPGGTNSGSSLQEEGCTSCEVEYWVAFQGSVSARLSLLLYCKYNVQNQIYESHVAGVMNSAASEINFSAAVGPETDREVFGQVPRIWGGDSDRPFVLADIVWWENTHFIWSGHGGPDAFGTSSEYRDTLATLSLSATDIGQALENTWNAVSGLTAAKNPKRYVEMNGCKTGTGFLPFAFGIPKINLDITSRPRQTFIGWNNVITEGFFARSKYQEYIVYLHRLWDGEMYSGIADASLRARTAGGNAVLAAEIAMFGSRLTTWLYNPDN